MTGSHMPTPPVSHVGIAVADLGAAIERYTLLLGRPPKVVEEVADMGVKVAVFETDNVVGGHIELLAATDPDSSIGRFVTRNGEGLHHVCIYVDDIEERLAALKSEGLRLIDETPRIGALGNRIAFVHPKGGHGVLIELEERAK